MGRTASKYPTNAELLTEIEVRLNRGSIVPLCRVRCGGCALTEDLGSTYPTEAEYVLRRMGWNRRRDRHYCPACMANGTADRTHAPERAQEDFS